ncbi:MAG TPA: protein kinase [Bryobacteraceae bacterium]|jgi:Tol biopolymer transport system component|nr:protein kinase [Bryobacteraceae bacterium]
MPLSPGEKLGPYEILTPLGKGGMGEVFRARDTQLDREAAIKVLPVSLARDPERLSRFEREARILASLNHPNIAQVYGIAEGGSIRGIAMELVPGANLAGPLPVETVIDYAGQIASALEAAHERGVVHRDLKPANVIVRPDGVVKVLDFGLARLGGPESEDPDNSPTLMASPTQAGIILGTAAYMSPEQARGKVVDKRADIWAFGVVLYEIVTGQRLFSGETVTDVLASVVKDVPDLSPVPVKLRRLIAKCLEKDPRKRLRDIGDWRELLDSEPAPPVAAAVSGRKSGLLWQTTTAAALLIAAGIAAVHFREKPAALPSPIRFQIQLPENASFEASTAVVLSPDGRHVAFAGKSNGLHIFIQDLDGGPARVLTNTVIGPQLPPVFWSPDSRYVAYSANSPRLSKVDVSSGAVQDICEKPGPPVGGAWNEAGTIIFGSTNGGLMRVPATGGNPTPFTKLDSFRGERFHQLPQFLPDGKHFLYFAGNADYTRSAEFVASIDDAPGAKPRLIVNTEDGASFVPADDGKPGWLLYLREGTLMAQPFDPEKLVLAGTPSPLPMKLGVSFNTALFAASRDLIVYRTGTAGRQNQMAWFDAKTGRNVGSVGEPGFITTMAVSGDETHAAYTKEDENGHSDIWVLDLARGASIRLSSGPADSAYPAWSSDSTEIAFSRLVVGTWQVFRKRADGSGAEQPVRKTSASARPTSWSPDGKFLLVDT